MAKQIKSMHHIFTFSIAQYRHQFLILPEFGQRLVGLVDHIVRIACEIEEETEWYFSVQGDGNNIYVLRLQIPCLGKGLFFVFDGCVHDHHSDHECIISFIGLVS